LDLPVIDGFVSNRLLIRPGLLPNGSNEVSAALAAFDARFTTNFTWGKNETPAALAAFDARFGTNFIWADKTRFGRNFRNGPPRMADVNGNGVLDVEDYGINVSSILGRDNGRAATLWDVSSEAIRLWNTQTMRRPGLTNLNTLRDPDLPNWLLAERFDDGVVADRWGARFSISDLSRFDFSGQSSSRQLEEKFLRRGTNARGFTPYFLKTFGQPANESLVFTRDNSLSMDGIRRLNLGVRLRVADFDVDMDEDGESDGVLSELEFSDPLRLFISQRQTVELETLGELYSGPVFTMPLPYRVTGSWDRAIGQNGLIASHPQIRKILIRQAQLQEERSLLLSRSYAVDDLILGGSVRAVELTVSGPAATRIVLAPITVPTVRYIQRPGMPGTVPVVFLPPSVLRDPVSYAPGMESSTAELLAVLEAETDRVSVKRGTVDRRAKKLIERARKRGWENVTIPGRNGVGGVTVRVNGAGQYKFERRLTDGLVEQVVCDGESLWHLYPDLMVGAKRSVSRFHRRAVHSLIPWLVASVDDLAIEANIELVDRHTIRIVSIRDKSEKTDGPRLAVELVFDNESRLTERRVVNLTDDKVLQRVSYLPDGTITVFAGASGKSHSLKLVRQSADAPNLTPPTDGLVVLPLPYRSAESYAVAVEDNGDGQTDYSKLSEADAMKMIATYFATRDAASMWQIIQQRFVAREDSRTGFATLLSSANPQDSTPIHEVASQNQGPTTSGTPGTLGSYLVQWYDWHHDRDLNREFVMPEHSSPFLKKLARAHNVLARWVSGRATQDRSKGQIRTEFRRAIAMIQEIESPMIGWRLLSAVAHRFTTDGVTDAAYLAPLAAEAARFEKYRGLGSQARLARIRWLLAAGRTEESQELYAEFLDTAASVGLSPTLDADIHSSFEEKFGNNAVWRKLVKKAGAMLATKDRPVELIALAAQCVRNAEQDLGQSLFESAVGELDLDEHPYVAVAGLSYARQAEDWATAEKCLQALLRDDQRLRMAGLWRQASDIAAQLGDEDESLRRYEQAIELEFADLPDMINLEQFRQEYGPVLARLEEFAQTRVIAEEPISDDLVDRVIRLADRWRSIDPDKTAACHGAARILEILGERELAWDYWTTPLAATPNDSSAWMALGRSLRDRSRIGDADRAFSEAFACEQTNPDILIERADMLLLDGQREAAMQLYGQISDGSWQPRFNGTKSRAAAALNATRQD
jgi:tetratricopeptide (TPR) repeat protein